MERFILLLEYYENMRKIMPLFLFLLFPAFLIAQKKPTITILTTGTKTSLRGLSVVNDNVIWVSGSGGTVGKSINAGKSWKWMKVNGFEKIEFRDIEAFDANTAIIMGIADPAYILKTTDGGDSWKVVYENKTKGMFLDAMDFSSNQNGIVIGDPINGKPFIAQTKDSGNTWQDISETANRPAVDSGEAFFASSGTNIKLFNNDEYYIVSGGLRARLINNTTATDLPLIQGKETTGGNSIDFYDNGLPETPGRRITVVGGDFNTPAATEKNCFYSTDGGKTWKAPKTPPHGYRSCVEYLSKKMLLSCGINGVDFSTNDGKTWKWISKEGFHVCRIAKIGKAIYLAGNNGKIGKLEWGK